MSLLLDKIQNSDFIYSATTNWGLKRYTCDVAFFTEEPLDDLFYIICSILDTNDGIYDKRSLGVLLGFSMMNHETKGKQDIYFDIYEVRLFEDILAKLENEHLIITIEEDNLVKLTNLGKLSLQDKKHYQFFYGTKNLYEHSNLKTDLPIAMLLFPFYNDMGIYTSIEGAKKVWPEDEEIDSIIHGKRNQLIKRLELQSNCEVNIYSASVQNYFDLESRRVSISLYKNGDDYIPVVMNGKQIAVKATGIILEPLNNLRKENLILECLFQKLWDDKEAILNYCSLEPFFDLVNYEDITKDLRTDWHDDKLFKQIVKCANLTCWRNISRFCDIDVLQQSLYLYKELIDWPIITERAEDEFLISSFLQYPWDLEILSEDRARNDSVIEKLLLLNKESIDDWNWEELGIRLSDEFVLNHLDILQVSLIRYTNDTEEVKKAILDNIDKDWDWEKIEKEFDIQYIFDNISQIGPHFTYKYFMDRVFMDRVWAERFANNSSFSEVLNIVCNNGGVLASSIYNDKLYVWTNDVINLFFNNGLLCWQSTPYMKGFECNPSLIWDKEFFSSYSKFITTEDGEKFVSGNINDIEILLSTPNFHWDWDAISANAHLLKSPQLYLSFGKSLNWSIIFDRFQDNHFFQSLPDINEMIGEDSDAWTTFSGFASTEFVKTNYIYPWDWSVLTERLFSKLKLENLGNKIFVDKWDWKYLSENVVLDFLLSNLERYKSYWDWNIVFPRILTPKNRLEPLFLDTIADMLTNISGKEKCSNAWHAFTSQYSFSELKELIKSTIRKRNYWWDIQSFCENPEFNVFRDIEECRYFIDWNIISSSESIDKSFKYNPKLKIARNEWKKTVRNLLSNPNNKWNFKLLSHFESLKDERWFLLQFKNKLDWDFLSEKSLIFTEKDKQNLNEIIEAFKSHINFCILSQRTDVDIEQIQKISPSSDFDFNALIERKAIKVTMEFIEERPDYKWDWFLVSSMDSFCPSSKFLLDHLSQNLNWNFLSKQDNSKAWSSEELICTIAQNETISNVIDWGYLSSQKYFPITIKVLESVPLIKLNWKNISSRKSIVSILEGYEEYVDWKIMSSNINLPIKENEILDLYKEYLDWHIVCTRNDFIFSNKIIEEFCDYIDWDVASSSLQIVFSKEFVERFQDKWNWPVLVKNKAFHNKVKISDFPYIRQHNIIEFIEKFPHRPKAYHFTHMSNAIKIIQDMRLQSRNYAEGKFVNSAGDNVNRTNKAHRFARFYFMPKSPTQFYNECLGKDHTDRYFQSAKKNGLPKCPMPVFFVFDIEELLMTIPDKCYYSNGNMQKDSSSYFKVIEEPNKIKAREIYINSKDTKNERQQEFLVDGEVDFSRLNYIRICCFDEYQASVLKKELSGTQWEDVVSVDESLYQRCNKTLIFKEGSDSIRISTDYMSPFEFKLSYSGETPIIENKDNVIRQRGNNIFVSKSIEVKKNTPFEIYFEVNIPRYNSWLIYRNIITE